MLDGCAAIFGIGEAGGDFFEVDGVEGFGGRIPVGGLLGGEGDGLLPDGSDDRAGLDESDADAPGGEFDAEGIGHGFDGEFTGGVRA